MTIIVTDDGFGPGTSQIDLTGARSENPNMIDVASDVLPETLTGKLDGVQLIRVDFPNFADGRGFSIARQLRLSGYTGRLRAKGHVIADQYAMARRSGFDEVEISEELAERQPESQWLQRANWRDYDYQSRLRRPL